MDKEKSKRIALFRYGIISDFINQTSLPYGKQEELFRIKSECKWKIPYSDRFKVSRGVIRHWLRLYNYGGKKLEALYPRERNDIDKSRVIDDNTASNIIWLIKNSDVQNVPELLDQMLIRGFITRGLNISTSTIYRFLHNNNLIDYLKNRGKCNKRSVENNEGKIEWVKKLLQGEICLSELETELYDKIPNEDIQKLYKCIKNKPLRYRKRAVCIISIYSGISQKTITAAVNISKSSIYNVAKNYSAKGIDCVVLDKRHCDHVYEDQKYIDKVFSIIHSPPSSFGFNRTSWRHDDIRKVMRDIQMPISKNCLCKIIKDSGYNYRKTRTVLTSNDPKYREKVEKIKKILSGLNSNKKFFSIDEYGPFAVKLQGGKSLVPPGITKSVPQWQKSKGSLIVTAALELSSNQITHFYSKNKNTAEMIKLLNLLIEKYSDQECIYFSWDAASWHASKELQKRVDEINSKDFKKKIVSPIVKLAPLPTCAQFLNVIESVFSGMARAIIHNSDYKSVQECKYAIDRYFFERNENFRKHPKRAGNKIWGKERVKPIFSEGNNCKDPLYR